MSHLKNRIERIEDQAGVVEKAKVFLWLDRDENDEQAWRRQYPERPWPPGPDVRLFVCTWAWPDTEHDGRPQARA